MKIFIDLGAYNGDTINKAIKQYGDVDLFVAFEPDPVTFKALRDNVPESVICYRAAASDTNGITKLYICPTGAMGHSLIGTKITVSDKFVEVEEIDFSEYINKFSQNDEIILKVDIEGKEYDLFRKLVSSPNIKLIKKLFCEWHYKKIGMSEEEHNKVVRLLLSNQININGNNSDEFR